MRFASTLLALGCLLSIEGGQCYESTIQAQTAPTPARVALERMSPAERSNACISVEFESSDDEAVSLGRQVERLWNGGQYDEALAQLGNLDARVGRVAIGNSWRTPVPTLAIDCWARDVRIGNRDSLLDLAFDVQDSSGNLFVALRHGGGVPHYSVCISSDGGATWRETFTWTGSPPTSLDAAVHADHFYVVYDSPEDDAQHIRLRRFLCSTGLADTLRGGANWVAACTLDVGKTMKEVSFGSYESSRLYVTALLSDGSVSLSYCWLNNGLWHNRSTGITSGASSGLDAAGNPDLDTTYLFLSYYDATDTLRIYRWSWSGFTQRFSRLSGRGTPTSIAAYDDTVICAYEDQISSPHQVRYVINYGDGDTWRTGTLSDPDTAAESPGVTSRGGAEFAVVFRHCAPTRELRFRRRPYDGPWSDPVSIADNGPYWNRPGIKCLNSSGAFGVVFLTNSGPVVRGAYFDRSDWTSGLAEQRRLMMKENILNVTPNPLSGHGRLSYILNRPADLRVRVYDRDGRVVRTLFDGPSPAGRQSLGFDATGMAPGVYFTRADADGRALTVPVTVVK